MRTETTSEHKYVGFSFEGSLPFREQLLRPFVEASVTLDRVRVPTKLVLWHEGGTGVSIHSEMRDLSEKIEVGVLQFAMTNRTKEKAADGYWETIETVPLRGFDARESISKLLIIESGYLCESGIVLKPRIGAECFIVADAFPCHLAVIGLEDLDSASRPEYDLTDYTRRTW